MYWYKLSWYHIYVIPFHTRLRHYIVVVEQWTKPYSSSRIQTHEDVHHGQEHPRMIPCSHRDKQNTGTLVLYWHRMVGPNMDCVQHTLKKKNLPKIMIIWVNKTIMTFCVTLKFQFNVMPSVSLLKMSSFNITPYIGIFICCVAA